MRIGSKRLAEFERFVARFHRRRFRNVRHGIDRPGFVHVGEHTAAVVLHIDTIRSIRFCRAVDLVILCCSRLFEACGIANSIVVDILGGVEETVARSVASLIAPAGCAQRAKAAGSGKSENRAEDRRCQRDCRPRGKSERRFRRRNESCNARCGDDALHQIDRQDQAAEAEQGGKPQRDDGREGRMRADGRLAAAAHHINLTPGHRCHLLFPCCTVSVHSPIVSGGVGDSAVRGLP